MTLKWDHKFAHYFRDSLQEALHHVTVVVKSPLFAGTPTEASLMKTQWSSTINSYDIGCKCTSRLTDCVSGRWVSVRPDVWLPGQRRFSYIDSLRDGERDRDSLRPWIASSSYRTQCCALSRPQTQSSASPEMLPLRWETARLKRRKAFIQVLCFGKSSRYNLHYAINENNIKNGSPGEIRAAHTVEWSEVW